MRNAEWTAGGGARISRVEEWTRERLYREDWAKLLPRAVRYAEQQIARRYWRGQKGGVLPRGFDANNVASEVIEGMLHGKCRLALGWTRERLEKEVQRRIRNEVRRLYSLTEAPEMRSEWDLLPLDENDQPQSVFDSMMGSIPDPCEEAEQNEEEAWRELVRKDFDAYLKEDWVARKVFECLCNGVVKRREIAERLGISVQAVTAARKRLERKVAGWKRQKREEGISTPPD
jgi:hypothetical protein